MLHSFIFSSTRHIHHVLSSIFAWNMDLLISSFFLCGWFHALFSRHAYSFLLNEKDFVNNVEDPWRICAFLCQGERMDQNEELDSRGQATILLKVGCLWLSLLCPRWQGSLSSWEPGMLVGLLLSLNFCVLQIVGTGKPCLLIRG